MVRLRALLLLVIVLPPCGTGQLASTTAPVSSPSALGKATVPLATPPWLRPTPTVSMPPHSAAAVANGNHHSDRDGPSGAALEPGAAAPP